MRAGFTVPHGPRFPGPPLSSRTVGFPESGWRAWDDPSALPWTCGGLSTGLHAPLTARFDRELEGSAKGHSSRVLGPKECSPLPPPCPRAPLPAGGVTSGWVTSRPPGRALPLRRRSDELMRRTKTLSQTSVVPTSASLRRLLPAPAGRWSFPTLSPRIFPQVSGPLPRWFSLVHVPVTSQRDIGLPRPTSGSASHSFRTATSVRVCNFEAAVIR